jgi:bifunctional DNA-binding transcriptional regulator/antitoxin component of YhaV-PrlF toxin-antitoxin module
MNNTTAAGHEIKIQVADRKGGKQYTFTIPVPIAEASGYEKGSIAILTLNNDGSVNIRKKRAT